MRSIAGQGPAILLIDHDMSLVLNVCDVVYVLEFGKLIFSGHAGRRRAPTRPSSRPIWEFRWRPQTAGADARPVRSST